MATPRASKSWLPAPDESRPLSKPLAAPTPVDRSQVRKLLGVYSGWALSLAVLWQTPFMHPVRMLTTLVHELGHLVAAVVSGGRVFEIVIEATGSGHVAQLDGAMWLMAPAGYLATVVVATWIFWASTDSGATTFTFWGLLALCTIYLGAGSDRGSIFSLGLLIAWFLLILLSPLHRLRGATARILALAMCINGIYDLARIFLHTRRAYGTIWDSVKEMPAIGSYYTDATIMAYQYGSSEASWAAIWLLLSLAIMGFGLRYSVRGELRRRDARERPTEVFESMRDPEGEGRYTIK